MRSPTGNSERIPIAPRTDIALIYGSIREGRLCGTVAAWAAAQIETNGGFALDVIDPADAEIAKAMAGDPAARSALLARLDRAQAFVVVTP